MGIPGDTSVGNNQTLRPNRSYTANKVLINIGSNDQFYLNHPDEIVENIKIL